MNRQERLKMVAGEWLEVAKRDGLVVPVRRVNRSQVDCGVSIDYLEKLVASLRSVPLMPTITQLFVNNVVNAVTAEHQCRFVDAIPDEHVGHATAVLSHARGGDFVEAITALVDDFNQRWEAHRAHRNQRKTAAQVMAEEQAAADAAAEAKRLQEQLELAAHIANTRAARSWAADSDSRHMSRREGASAGSHDTLGLLPTASSGAPLSQQQSSSPRAAQEGGRAGARLALAPSASTDDDGGDGGGTPGRRGTGGGRDHEQSSNSSPSARGAQQLRVQTDTPRDGEVGSPSPSRRQEGDDPQATPTQAQRRSGGFASLVSPKMGEVVDAVLRRAVLDKLSSSSPGGGEPGGGGKPSLRAAGKKVVMMQARAMGAETSMFMRGGGGGGGGHAAGGHDDGKPQQPSLLARTGTLHRVATLAHHQRHVGAPDDAPPSVGWSPSPFGAPFGGPPGALTTTSLMLMAQPLGVPLIEGQSIYQRAKASTDLTRLLKPMDEEEELYQAFLKAQKAASDRLAAAKAAQEQTLLREEKSKMLGYYVWIDVFALEQFKAPSPVPQPVDLTTISRLINVVGRTIVIVDDDWRALRRLWCLYEIWTTLRFKGQLITLSTTSALQAAATGASPKPLRSKLSHAWSVNSAATTARPDSAASQQHHHRGDADGDADQAAGAKSPEPPDADLGPDADGPVELLPVPQVDLLEAKASLPEDRHAILAVWHEEVASPRTQTHSLRQIALNVRRALQLAREREARKELLCRQIYTGLALCGRNWRGVLSSGFKELDAAREALKMLVEEHMSVEYGAAKDVQAASSGDVELELWQLIRFVARQLLVRKEEPWWILELNRYANLAQQSFAKRFSSTYVDQLLRAAGTIDDMKVLRSYVYSQMHTRTSSRRQDLGD